MKKLILFCLIALVAVGVYADSNTVWRYSSEAGLYHITQDVIIFNGEDIVTPEDGTGIMVTFANIGGDIIMLIAPGDPYNLDGKIDRVFFADSIDTLEETGTMFEATFTDGCVSFSDDDSEYIYNEMKYATQKFFMLMNSENSSEYVLFNVNCDRLYKYSNYLSKSMF